MHQSTTPSLSQTIWPRWASRQFLTLPKVQTLLSVTFGYSLSSEAVDRGDERGCDEDHWHAHTRGLPWGSCWSCWNGRTSVLQRVEITFKGTSVLFVLSIKVPIRKKSGNLFNDHRNRLTEKQMYRYFKRQNHKILHEKNTATKEKAQKRNWIYSNSFNCTKLGHKDQVYLSEHW